MDGHLNQMLVNALSKFAQEHRESWDEHLAKVVYSFTTIKSMPWETFIVGSLVLKKDFRRKRQRGGKVDYRWQGPFAIIAVLRKGLYSLKERDGDQVLNKCMFL